MAETLDVRLQEAAANRLTHAEFLELILNDELAVRDDRAIDRRTRAACFRDQKRLEDFDCLRRRFVISGAIIGLTM